MIVVGIDENGLGPVLGPMVVTGATFRSEQYHVDQYWQLADAKLPADDSKVVFKKHKLNVAESAVLHWLSVFKQFPRSANELYSAICVDAPPPCPAQSPLVCRPQTAFAVPTFGGTAPNHLLLDIWNRFDARQISPLQVMAYMVCPGEFNKQLSDPSLNKLQFDFNLMLGLIKKIVAQFPDETVWAICGKVGGTKKYLPWFEALGFHDCQVLEETRDVSRYQVLPSTTISFIKDGDGFHLPVAVASMVGKYLRELSMHETNQLLAPTAPPVSGYRDTRTKAFIEATTATRSTLSLPDSCFLRNS